MLAMYEVEKELTVDVTTDSNIDTVPINQSCNGQDESTDEPHRDEESEYSISNESHHSRYSTDNEVELEDDEDQSFSHNKKSVTMKVNSTFDNVTEFRKALIHYALTNEFEYFYEKNDQTRVTARCANLECKSGKDIDVHIVVSLDIMKRHAKIRHLKVFIKTNHQV